MRWIIYNLLFSIGYPLVALGYLPRMWRRGGYRHAFGQRFGFFDPDVRRRLAGPPRVWIHGVSVGEVGVALQLAAALRTVDPSLAFVISTTTSTGYALAASRAHADDLCLYLPLDYPWIQGKVLDRVCPRAVVLIESEFWPNLIRAAHRRSIPLFLVNGRISDRSFPGYRWLRGWFGPLLGLFDHLFAQSALDADRLRGMGAPASRVTALANLKYDAVRRDAAGEHDACAVCLRAGIAGADRVVLMGGSTWPGEEAMLLRFYASRQPVFPGLRLILAPRHAERAAEVESLALRLGMSCLRVRTLRASPMALPPSSGVPPVLLIDTTGDLMNFYASADLVFVGKSLCARGAQNMMEPAGCGCAVLVGPHTENFRAVMRDFRDAGAIRLVADAAELDATLEDLVRDRDARTVLSSRAQAVVESRRGVTHACATRILAQIHCRETPHGHGN